MAPLHKKHLRIVKQILPITEHNAGDSMKSATFEKLRYEAESAVRHDYLGLLYFQQRGLTPQELYIQ
jgi:hypothetical protein